jgi:hypothetical protein
MRIPIVKFKYQIFLTKIWYFHKIIVISIHDRWSTSHFKKWFHDLGRLQQLKSEDPNLGRKMICSKKDTTSHQEWLQENEEQKVNHKNKLKK